MGLKNMFQKVGGKPVSEIESKFGQIRERSRLIIGPFKAMFYKRFSFAGASIQALVKSSPSTAIK